MSQKRIADRLYLEELVLANETTHTPPYTPALLSAPWYKGRARIFVPDRCGADLTLVKAVLFGGAQDQQLRTDIYSPAYSIFAMHELPANVSAPRARAHTVVSSRPVPEVWRVQGPGWFEIEAEGTWEIETTTDAFDVFASALIYPVVGGLCKSEIDDLLSQAKIEAY